MIVFIYVVIVCFPIWRSAVDTTIVISPTVAVLGEIGLPAPVRELASRRWDVVIVGAGHNGLACAAYLARAGKRVLVLESRTRVGGACTIEEPFPGVRMSPCAYLAGLLHPLVVSELSLPDCAMRCVQKVTEICGSASLPPRNRLKGGSGKMSKQGTCSSTGRWPSSLNTTCVTNGCRLRTSGKA